jgi:SPP1 family predicted phage head-tail adaptor
LQEDRGRLRDPRGQHIEDWETVKRLWAAITPLSGRELERAQEIVADATLLVELRYGPPALQVTAKHRLRWVEDEAGERVVYLAEPPRNTDGRREKLEVLAREKEKESA